jgi:hypothetical protein
MRLRSGSRLQTYPLQQSSFAEHSRGSPFSVEHPYSVLGGTDSDEAGCITGSFVSFGAVAHAKNDSTPQKTAPKCALFMIPSSSRSLSTPKV